MGLHKSGLTLQESYAALERLRECMREQNDS
jgi:hypothetical protein